MIFVMGAPGLVASELIPILARRNAALRIGIHSRMRTVLEAEADAVRVDYDDVESIVNAFTGCRSLYLLTPFTVDQVAVEMRAVEAAHKAGVEKIVKQSVPGTQGLPDFGLGERHHNIEQYIQKLGMKFTFLRPHSFMQDFAFHCGDTIRQLDRFFKPDGEAAVSYVDSRDVAAVAAEALLTAKYDGMSLNLTGGEAITNLEVAAILSRILHRPIRFSDVQPALAVDAMRQAGMDEDSIGVLLALHPFNKTPMAANVTGTIREVLGRDPESFEQFVRDYRSAFERVQQPGHPHGESDRGAPRAGSWERPARDTDA